MAKKRKTLAVAESCTGGLLGHLLTEVSGASRYFRGGVIAYGNAVKTSLLGVSKRLLKQNGAVSAAAAEQMALGVRRRFKTELGIGITGIAGPTGGTRKKPVGLVYIALAGRRGVVCKKFLFSGKRSVVKRRAAKKALAWLRRAL